MRASCSMLEGSTLSCEAPGPPVTITVLLVLPVRAPVCSAMEFVWSQDSSDYAIREGSNRVKIHKNFQEKATLKVEYSVEGIHGGALVGECWGSQPRPFSKTYNIRVTLLGCMLVRLPARRACVYVSVCGPWSEAGWPRSHTECQTWLYRY